MQENLHFEWTIERRPSAEMLLSKLPPIRRMRGWRLYAVNGSRILSLWSDYGRNLLGYTPRGLAEHAKSALDRGLTSAVPGYWNDRIMRMTRKLYPEYTFIRLQSAPSHPLGKMSTRFLFEDYLRAHESAETKIARERNAPQKTDGQPRAVHIIVPVPQAFSIGILGFSSQPLDESGHELVDGMRGVCTLFGLSLMASEQHSSVLTARLEKSWKRFDRCDIELFSRHGPWLMPRYSPEVHAELFAFCAARGVLISPDYFFPSSVPGDFDEGELRCLQEAAATFL